MTRILRRYTTELPIGRHRHRICSSPNLASRHVPSLAQLTGPRLFFDGIDGGEARIYSPSSYHNRNGPAAGGSKRPQKQTVFPHWEHVDRQARVSLLAPDFSSFQISHAKPNRVPIEEIFDLNASSISHPSPFFQRETITGFLSVASYE